MKKRGRGFAHRGELAGVAAKRLLASLHGLLSCLRRRLRALALLIVSVVFLGGCSPVTNVVSGLSMPQSTISGSNYLYVVDPANNQVTNGYNPALAGENINADDTFAIVLDFGFLRYLQAVDPCDCVFRGVDGKRASSHEA